MIRHIWNGGELSGTLHGLSASDALFLGLSVNNISEQVALACLDCIEDEVISQQDSFQCLMRLESSLCSDGNVPESDHKFRYVHKVTRHVADRLLARQAPLRRLEDHMIQLLIRGVNSLAIMRKGPPGANDLASSSARPRADVEIIDLLLLSTWPGHLHMRFINAIFSIEPLLKKRHLSLFQVSPDFFFDIAELL